MLFVQLGSGGPGATEPRAGPARPWLGMLLDSNLRPQPAAVAKIVVSQATERGLSTENSSYPVTAADSRPAGRARSQK